MLKKNLNYNKNTNLIIFPGTMVITHKYIMYYITRVMIWKVLLWLSRNSSGI